MRRVAEILAGLLLGLGAAGCAGSGAVPPPEVLVGERAPYVIGAGDVLSVRVWKNPELSVEVPVRPDGKISVPLVDDVQAAGLTTLELKEVLTKSLSEFVSNADVTVVLTQVNSKRAYVVGAVLRSGPVPLIGDLRVLDALSLAGGFSQFADKGKIKVIRRSEKGDVEYHFDYDAYVAGNAPGTNLLLQPGDTVVVPD